MYDYDSINVGFDNGFDKYGNTYYIVCIRREDFGDYKTIVEYTDADAIKLHRMVTEQGYLKKHDVEIREQTINEALGRLSKVALKSYTHNLISMDEVRIVLEQMKGEL